MFSAYVCLCRNSDNTNNINDNNSTEHNDAWTYTFNDNNINGTNTICMHIHNHIMLMFMYVCTNRAQLYVCVHFLWSWARGAQSRYNIVHRHSSSHPPLLCTCARSNNYIHVCMRACTSWAFCTQVHNKQYGLDVILAKKSIAVNMYFQSTASQDGPGCRTAKGIHKTSLVKALFDYANKQQARAEPSTDLVSVARPSPLRASAFDVVVVYWRGFATVLEQRVLCAVSRTISGKMPIATRNTLHFERIVKKFAWSSAFASMLDGIGLATSEKIRVVAGVYEYLESTNTHIAPKVLPGDERAWGMIVAYFAVSFSAMSEASQEAVRHMVRTWFSANQRVGRLEEQCRRLVNRWFSEDVD